jgi:hypothetical protein
MGWEGPNNIFFIEIFEPFRRKGHGNVFIRKIEEEVKKMGCKCVTAYPVIDESIWLKWGFKVEKVVKGDKLLKKEL